MLVKIKREALESALEGARNVFPNEFIALLRGEERESEILLTEVIIAPFSNYGKGFSSFSDIHLPPSLRAIASFHSHPCPPASPSRGDLQFFSRTARFHFIACPPFTRESTRAFDSRGREIGFAVVK